MKGKRKKSWKTLTLKGTKRNPFHLFPKNKKMKRKTKSQPKINVIFMTRTKKLVSIYCLHSKKDDTLKTLISYSYIIDIIKRIETLLTVTILRWFNILYFHLLLPSHFPFSFVLFPRFWQTSRDGVMKC